MPFGALLLLFLLYQHGAIERILDGSYEPRLTLVAEHKHRTGYYVAYCDTGFMAFSSAHIRVRRVVRIGVIEFYDDIRVIPKLQNARFGEGATGELLLLRTDRSVVTVLRS